MATVRRQGNNFSSNNWIYSMQNRYFCNLEDFNIKPHFIDKCRFFKNESDILNGKKLNLDLTPLQFDWLINVVWNRITQPDLDHVKNRSIKDLGEIIQSVVEEILKKNDVQDKPQLLRKWLLAEAVSAWVATHVVADRELERAPSYIRGPRGQSSAVLSFDPPMGVCAGFNSVTRDLSASIGLKCAGLGGELRGLGSPFRGSDNHGWNHFDFGDGIEALTDNTQGRVDLKAARSMRGKPSWVSILPKSPVEWELFLAEHYSIQLMGEYVPEKGGTRYKDTSYYSMLSISYKEWGSVDTSYLKPIIKDLDTAKQSRIMELNRFKKMPSSSM